MLGHDCKYGPSFTQKRKRVCRTNAIGIGCLEMAFTVVGRTKMEAIHLESRTFEAFGHNYCRKGISAGLSRGNEMLLGVNELLRSAELES